MSELLEQFQDLLNNDAVKSSLTASALRQIDDIIDEASELKEKYAALQDKYDTKVKHQERTALELVNANDELDAFRNRHEELLDREKKITELELTAKHQTKRVDDHKAMVELVFRNVDIVRNQLGHIPVINKMSDGTSFSSTEYSDTTETETRK